MHKDFKTGMALGLVLVTAFALWLSTRPSLSTKARMLGPYSAAHRAPALREPRKMGIPLHSHSSGPLEEIPIDGNSTKQLKSLIAIDRPAQGDELKLPEFSANEQAKKIKTKRFHIVRRGETLSGISYKYYGSVSKWRKILDANGETIKNPNRLRLGMKLYIPD